MPGNEPVLFTIETASPPRAFAILLGSNKNEGARDSVREVPTTGTCVFSRTRGGGGAFGYTGRAALGNGGALADVVLVVRHKLPRAIHRKAADKCTPQQLSILPDSRCLCVVDRSVILVPQKSFCRQSRLSSLKSLLQLPS